MLSLSTARAIVTGAVGLGAYDVATKIIKNNIAIPETVLKRALTNVGIFGLGTVAADKAVDAINSLIDSAIEEWEDRKNKKEAPEQELPEVVEPDLPANTGPEAS